MINIETLSVREQFEIVMSVSAICLVTAVSFREWVKDPHVRMIGRVLGVAGWLVVAAYSYDATKVIESQIVQLAGKQQKAEGIAAEVAVMFTSAGANRIIIKESLNGVRRGSAELYKHDGSMGRSGSGQASGTTGATATRLRGDGSDGSSNDGRNDPAELPRWAEWFSRNVHRNAGSVEFSGEAQGQAF